MNFFKMAVVSVLALGVMFSTGCAGMNQKQQMQVPQKTDAEREAEVMQRLWGTFVIILDDKREFVIRKTGDTPHKAFETFCLAMNSGHAPDGTTNYVVKHFVVAIEQSYVRSGYNKNLEDFFKEYMAFRCVKQEVVQLPKAKGSKSEPMSVHMMEFQYDPNLLPKPDQQVSQMNGQYPQHNSAQQVQQSQPGFWERIGQVALPVVLTTGIVYGISRLTR